MKHLPIALITVILFSLGLVSAPTMAAALDYGLAFTAPDPWGLCNEVYIGFRFNNDGRASGGTMDVTLTITGSEGVVLKTWDTFAFDYEPDPPYSFEKFLDVDLKSGKTYKVVISTTDVSVDTTFVAGNCGDSASADNSDPVELPPCELSDDRLDKGCSPFVVTYAYAREDGCYINIYSKYARADGKIVLLLQATPAEIAAAQAAGGNAVIDTIEVVNLTEVTAYWLPGTNEFQINAGPNAEGKVYVLNFTGCPATNIYTTNSYQKAE